jgi:hypothetical protein
VELTKPETWREDAHRFRGGIYLQRIGSDLRAQRHAVNRRWIGPEPEGLGLTNTDLTISILFTTLEPLKIIFAI